MMLGVYNSGTGEAAKPYGYQVLERLGVPKQTILVTAMLPRINDGGVHT